MSCRRRCRVIIIMASRKRRSSPAAEARSSYFTTVWRKSAFVTAPGDYIFVPPYVPHREENPDPDHPAVIVIARSTQEAIVVNLKELYALSGSAD